MTGFSCLSSGHLLDPNKHLIFLSIKRFPKKKKKALFLYRAVPIVDSERIDAEKGDMLSVILICICRHASRLMGKWGRT